MHLYFGVCNNNNNNNNNNSGYNFMYGSSHLKQFNDNNINIAHIIRFYRQVFGIILHMNHLYQLHNSVSLHSLYI